MCAHDGTPLDAQAVRFSFERAMAPESTNKARKALFDNLADIATPNTHTVVLTLRHPDPHLLFRSGEATAVILHPDSAHAATALKRALAPTVCSSAAPGTASPW